MERGHSEEREEEREWSEGRECVWSEERERIVIREKGESSEVRGWGREN